MKKSDFGVTYGQEGKGSNLRGVKGMKKSDFGVTYGQGRLEEGKQRRKGAGDIRSPHPLNPSRGGEFGKARSGKFGAIEEGKQRRKGMVLPDRYAGIFLTVILLVIFSFGIFGGVYSGIFVNGVNGTGFFGDIGGNSSAIDIGDGEVGSGISGSNGNQASTVTNQGTVTGTSNGSDYDGGYRQSYPQATRTWSDIVDSEQSRGYAFDQTGGSNRDAARSGAEVYSAWLELKLSDGSWDGGYVMARVTYDLTISGNLLTAMKNGYISQIKFDAWIHAFGKVEEGDQDKNGNYPPETKARATLYNDNTNNTFPTVKRIGGGFLIDTDYEYEEESATPIHRITGGDVASDTGAKAFNCTAINGVDNVKSFANNKPYLRFVVISFCRSDEWDYDVYLRAQAAIEAVKLSFTYTGNTPTVNFDVNDSAYGSVSPATIAGVAATPDTFDPNGIKTATGSLSTLMSVNTNTAVPNEGYYFDRWSSADGILDANNIRKLKVPLLTKAWFNYPANSEYAVTANFEAIDYSPTTSFTYDGSGQGPALDADGNNYTIVTHKYEGRISTSYGNEEKPKNAGDYTYTATLKRDGETIGSKKYDFTIGKKLLTITPNGGQKKTYGDPDPILTFTSDAVSGETPKLSKNLTRENGETARGYIITFAAATILEDDGSFLAANYELRALQVAITFTIERRIITLSAKSITDKSLDKVYDGNDVIGVSATDNLGTYLNISSLQNDALSPNLGDTINNIFTVSLWKYKSKNVSDTNAVELTVELNAGRGANFYVDAAGTTTFACELNGKITKKALTVTAENKAKVYGENDPELTYAAGAAVGSEKPAFTGGLKRVSGENVSSYDILNNGETPLTLANGADGFLASNYSLDFTKGTFTITPITLTLTPNSNQTKIYGDTDPILAFTSDAINVQTAALNKPLTRDQGESAGEYNILLAADTVLIDNGDFLAVNYTLSFTSGVKFAITKRTLSLSVSPPSSAPSKVYDGLLSAPNSFAVSHSVFADYFVISSDGSVSGLGNGDTVSAVFTIGSAVYDSKDVSVASKITQTVTLSGTAANNYILNATAYDFEAEITKKALTVTAVDKTKVYGETDPELTFTPNPYLTGIGSETAAFSGGLQRGTGEDVKKTGGYVISNLNLTLIDGENGFLASNYSLDFTNGTFTITPKGLTLTPNSNQTKIYGDTDPILAFTSNAINEQTAALSKPLTRDQGESAGEYNILLDGAVLADNGNFLAVNYTLSFTSGVKFVITKRIITLSAKTITDNSLDKVYDGNDVIGVSATDNLETYLDISPLQNDALSPNLGDTIDNIFTVSLWRYKSKNVSDTNAVELTVELNAGRGANFYVDAAGTTTFACELNGKITKKALTVTAENKTKVYGENDPELTYAAGAAVGSEKTAFTGKLKRVSGENVSSYDILNNGETPLTLANDADGFTASNYTLNFTKGTFTITKRTIVLQVSASAPVPSKTYDGTDSAASALPAITDGVSGNLGSYLVPQSGYSFGNADTILTVFKAESYRYDSKNVGTAADGRKIILDIEFKDDLNAANYTLAVKTYYIGADIGEAAISVLSGVSAVGRVYDGTNLVALSFGTIVYSGKCGSDDVAIDTAATYAATANDKNHGTGKLVSIVGGLLLTGTDAANYTLAQPVLTVDISQRTLLITQKTPVISKSHDGTTAVKVLDGTGGRREVLPSDLETFLDISDYGEGDGFPLLASILNIVEFNYTTAVLETNKTAVLKISIDSNGNYTLPQTEFTFHYENVKITNESIVLVLKSGLLHSALSKAYDGTVSVPDGIKITPGNINNYLDMTSGVIEEPGGLSAVLTVSQAFLSKDASEAAYIRITLSAAEGTTYDFPNSEFDIPAEISKRELSVSVLVNGKTYDGTAAAEVDGVTFTGLQNGETLTPGTDFLMDCAFDGADASDTAAFTALIALTETAISENYALAATEYKGSAVISKKILTLDAKGKTVVFDGSKHSAEFRVLSGVETLSCVLTDDGKISVSTGVLKEEIPFTPEIKNTADGSAVTGGVMNAGRYEFKYTADAQTNYTIENDGAAVFVIIEKASREAFEEFIGENVGFNDAADGSGGGSGEGAAAKRYVYTEGAFIVPRVLAEEIAEEYGVRFVSCDTEAIAHSGVYSVRFTFDTGGNFDTDGVIVVQYTIDPRPVEFKIKRERGKITVENPVPGARYRLVNAKDKKTKADWQTSPVFTKVNDNQNYIVEMELQGYAKSDYAPDRTKIDSAAIGNDLMIWIIVALILALIFIIYYIGNKRRKEQTRQVPMGMMPFGPTVPMPGFTAPKLPTAPGLKKFPAGKTGNAPKPTETKKSGTGNAKPEAAKTGLKKGEAPKTDLKKAEVKTADVKKGTGGNAVAAPKLKRTQLVKAKSALQKRETVPMLNMKFVKDSSHYGGNAVAESGMVMRDKD